MAQNSINSFLDIIVKCQKEYDKNLKNKKIMFIIEDKNKKLSKIEAFFGEKNFYHLTGVVAFDKDGGELSSHNFYSLLNNGRIDRLKLKRRDNTTDLKLRVLPQLMRIDKIANIIGDFTNYSMLLQTEKIAGTTNACMGFVHDTKLDVYIPNTALQKDIRDITTNRDKIIAILKKDITSNLYQNITYLNKNYTLNKIVENKLISKYIDTENLHSDDRNIDKKIYDFYYKVKESSLNWNNQELENMSDKQLDNYKNELEDKYNELSELYSSNSNDKNFQHEIKQIADDIYNKLNDIDDLLENIQPNNEEEEDEEE